MIDMQKILADAPEVFIDGPEGGLLDSPELDARDAHVARQAALQALDAVIQHPTARITQGKVSYTMSNGEEGEYEFDILQIPVYELDKLREQIGGV